MSAISNMTETWRELKLAEIQADMDQTATQLANRKDESDSSRKKLIVESKKFKKDTPEESRKQVQPLLKLFQSEVDALSKRAKWAETAFLSIYKKIIELPDPLPALEQAENLQKKVQKLGEIEIENQKLKDTINTYKKDFAEMKNNETKVQKLEKQLNEAKECNQENANKVFEEREKELLHLFEEKEKEMIETQRMVAAKLETVESRAANSQQKLETTQNELMEAKTKFEEDRIAKNEEIELIMNDLDRAHQNYQSAQKEVEHLREQLKTGIQNRPVSNLEKEFDVASLENESKERELAQLTSELAKSEEKSVFLQSHYQKQIQDLTEKTQFLAEERKQIEAQLVNQKDYLDIKRECEILKETQFSGIDKQKLESQTLEALLLSQNRNLQNENSSMRKQINEINGELNNVQVRENILKNQVQNQDALIEKLEKDLLSVNALPSAYRTVGDGASSTSPNVQHEFLENALKDVTQRSSALLQEIPQAELADPSLLAIVQSQRERFRLRVQELENENSHLSQNMQALSLEIENLRMDNVKLYEKIKFLQNYRPNSSYQANLDDEAGKKYASQYEDQLDPFMKFSRNEKLRKYTNLSAHDKITLNMGKFILSNKIARTCIFVYTIVIHMLLYLILYKFGNTTDCKNHLAELCIEKFGESRAPCIP